MCVWGQRLQAQVAHRGFYIFKIDASELLDPYDRDLMTTPEVYEVAMNSQLHTPVSDDMGVTIGGGALILVLSLLPPSSIACGCFHPSACPCPPAYACMSAL